jgi:hypothetical protein
MPFPTRLPRGAFYIALTLLFAATVPADPIITEFLATNSNVRADSDGSFSDWIELHNPDAAPVDLAGWFLTDDAKALGKWHSITGICSAMRCWTPLPNLTSTSGALTLRATALQAFTA